MGYVLKTVFFDKYNRINAFEFYNETDDKLEILTIQNKKLKTSEIREALKFDISVIVNDPDNFWAEKIILLKDAPKGLNSNNYAKVLLHNCKYGISAVRNGGRTKYTYSICSLSDRGIIDKVLRKRYGIELKEASDEIVKECVPSKYQASYDTCYYTDLLVAITYTIRHLRHISEPRFIIARQEVAKCDLDILAVINVYKAASMDYIPKYAIVRRLSETEHTEGIKIIPYNMIQEMCLRCCKKDLNVIIPYSILSTLFLRLTSDGAARYEPSIDFSEVDALEYGLENGHGSIVTNALRRFKELAKGNDVPEYKNAHIIDASKIALEKSSFNFYEYLLNNVDDEGHFTDKIEETNVIDEDANDEGVETQQIEESADKTKEITDKEEVTAQPEESDNIDDTETKPNISRPKRSRTLSKTLQSELANDILDNYLHNRRAKTINKILEGLSIFGDLRERHEVRNNIAIEAIQWDKRGGKRYYKIAIGDTSYIIVSTVVDKLAFVGGISNAKFVESTAGLSTDTVEPVEKMQDSIIDINDAKMLRLTIEEQLGLRLIPEGTLVTSSDVDVENKKKNKDTNGINDTKSDNKVETPDNVETTPKVREEHIEPVVEIHTEPEHKQSSSCSNTNIEMPENIQQLYRDLMSARTNEHSAANLVEIYSNETSSILNEIDALEEKLAKSMNNLALAQKKLENAQRECSVAQMELKSALGLK